MNIEILESTHWCEETPHSVVAKITIDGVEKEIQQVFNTGATKDTIIIDNETVFSNDPLYAELEKVFERIDEQGYDEYQSFS